MLPVLKHIQAKLYNPSALLLTDYETEKEGRIYEACRFNLNDKRIICRTAKITPKKIGQFVTFWNRNAEGVTQPFYEKDDFDFYVINVCKGECLGQFVFPKSIGVAKGLISTTSQEGKRGFRVYPPWDIAKNAQAKRTQQWQLDYFIYLKAPVDFEWVKRLYA